MTLLQFPFAAARVAPSRRRQSLRIQSQRINGTQTAKNEYLRLSYNTSWKDPVIHYSFRGQKHWSSKKLMQDVMSGGFDYAYCLLETDASSSSTNDDDDGGASHSSTNDDDDDDDGGASHHLEFVITDGRGNWDKSSADENYKISASSGSFLLHQGAVHEVPSHSKVLLVSDVDDTMVGKPEVGADDATAAFTDWWRRFAVPAGGRLVFNTGRAVDLVEELLQEKNHCLAVPDILITGVGTKMYTK